MNIRTRLKTLEQRIPTEVKTKRVILIAVPGEPVQLERSRCTRTRQGHGDLFEFVILNGPRDGLSDADLEKWIQSTPIEG
jgi:hypothetical protein